MASSEIGQKTSPPNKSLTLPTSRLSTACTEITDRPSQHSPPAFKEVLMMRKNNDQICDEYDTREFCPDNLFKALSLNHRCMPWCIHVKTNSNSYWEVKSKLSDPLRPLMLNHAIMAQPQQKEKKELNGVVNEACQASERVLRDVSVCGGNVRWQEPREWMHPYHQPYVDLQWAERMMSSSAQAETTGRTPLYWNHLQIIPYSVIPLSLTVTAIGAFMTNAHHMT